MLELWTGHEYNLHVPTVQVVAPLLTACLYLTLELMINDINEFTIDG